MFCGDKTENPFFFFPKGGGRGRLSGEQPLVGNVPEDEWTDGQAFGTVVHRAPPSTQDHHPAGEDHALVGPVIVVVQRDGGAAVDLSVERRQRAHSRAVWIIGRGRAARRCGGRRGGGGGIEAFHHADALPARNPLLLGEPVQHAKAIERRGINPGSGEDEVVDTSEWCSLHVILHH